MIDKPKVSICIPVYNRAKYIAQCIESALSQDYENLEVIISDNCSTDNTVEIIERYLGDKRIRFYRNSENIGGGPNCDLLLGYASGEWMMYIGSDDYLIDDNFISQAVERIQKNPNLSAVCGGYNIFWENGTRETVKHSDSTDMVLSGRDIFLMGTDVWHVFFRHASVIKTSIVRNLELDIKEFNAPAGDSGTMSKLALFGDIHLLRKPILMFRVHDDNDSNCDSNERFESYFLQNVNVPIVLYKYAKKNNIFQINVLDKWLVKNIISLIVSGPEGWSGLSSRFNKYEGILKDRGVDLSDFGIKAIFDRVNKIIEYEDKVNCESGEFKIENLCSIINELKLVGYIKHHDFLIRQKLKDVGISNKTIRAFLELFFYSKISQFMPDNLNGIQFSSDIACVGSFDSINNTTEQSEFVVSDKDIDIIGKGWIFNMLDSVAPDTVYILLVQNGAVKYTIETRKNSRLDLAKIMGSDLFVYSGYYFIMPADAIILGEYDIVTVFMRGHQAAVFYNKKRLIIS